MRTRDGLQKVKSKMSAYIRALDSMPNILVPKLKKKKKIKRHSLGF